MVGETYLDSSQHNTRIRMLQLRNHPLTNMLTLPFIHRRIPRQRIQNRHAAPFRAFVQCDEEFVEYGVGDDEDVFRGSGGDGCGVDVCECAYCVRYDL